MELVSPNKNLNSPFAGINSAPNGMSAYAGNVPTRAASFYLLMSAVLYTLGTSMLVGAIFLMPFLFERNMRAIVIDETRLSSLPVATSSGYDSNSASVGGFPSLIPENQRMNREFNKGDRASGVRGDKDLSAEVPKAMVFKSDDSNSIGIGENENGKSVVLNTGSVSQSETVPEGAITPAVVGSGANENHEADLSDKESVSEENELAPPGVTRNGAVWYIQINKFPFGISEKGKAQLDDVFQWLRTHRRSRVRIQGIGNEKWSKVARRAAKMIYDDLSVKGVSRKRMKTTLQTVKSADKVEVQVRVGKRF